MSETEGTYSEPDAAIAKAFPYALADNDRNRMVFSAGYRAGREAALRESAEAVLSMESARVEPDWGTVVRKIDARDAIFALTTNP